MAPNSRRLIGCFAILGLFAVGPLGWLAGTSYAEERKFVVLLADLPKDAPGAIQLPNPADIRDGYFDKVKNAEPGQSGVRIDSFSEWWEEVSYGDVTVSGDVFGWVQLPWTTRPDNVDGNFVTIPNIELQGGSSFQPGVGESYDWTLRKFKYDLDGAGESLFLGNEAAVDFPGMYHFDPTGFPVWAPGERFVDLNGNGNYDAGVREYWIDKDNDGRLGAKAASFQGLFGANIEYPEDDQQPKLFIGWASNAEWFDSNGDGQWNVDGFVTFEQVATFPYVGGGSRSYVIYRGDWGGTEVWFDRNGDWEPGSRAEPDEQAGETPPATLWRFLIGVHDPDDDGVEYFDEQWNESYDFAEPFEDFMRRWAAGSHSFVQTSATYVRNNYPADTQPFPSDPSINYVEELIARTGNGRYDAPDGWSNNGTVNSSNKLQEVLPLLADTNEANEQRDRSNATTPRPGNYNDVDWYEDFWQERYGTDAPPWRSTIPYLRRFNPGQPIPRRAADAEDPAMPFEPNRGGILMALGFPATKSDGARYGSGDGTVLPNIGDANQGMYDGMAEYDDLPSSIYHAAGDQDFGEVTGPDGNAYWGFDVGPNIPEAPSMPDSRIVAAGPLAYNIHGDGGYDAGNQLNIEYLTWRTNGESSTDLVTEEDFDGDGTVDASVVYYHRDVNLDGMIDLGETPGVPGEFGLPNPHQLHNYCYDMVSGTPPTGANSRYPFNRIRFEEDLVEALDGSVDWDEFLGGPPPFGDTISGVALLSTRTQQDGPDVFQPPAVGGLFGSSLAEELSHPEQVVVGWQFSTSPGNRFIRTRDVVVPGATGREYYKRIRFWGGMGISMNDGRFQSTDPYSDNQNFAQRWTQHEYGHIWEGFPDLYDYDIIEDDPSNIINNPIGAWCIMASGGAVHPVPILKADSGWLTPVDITAALTPAGLTELEIRAWEFDRNKTVFTYENPLYPGEEIWFWRNSPGVMTGGALTRQAFDVRQPAYGMIVMHVDRSANPEGLPPQQRIGDGHFTYLVVQADGLQQLENNENGGDGGDVWPGTSGRTTWNRDTDPPARWHSGQGTGLDIVNIRPKDNSTVVTFRWTPQELPSLSWVQPPGGISVNGRYSLKYFTFDQFGGTTIQFFAHKVIAGQEQSYDGILIGATSKAPGEVNGVFLANIAALEDGTYTFFARLIPGIGSDGNAESWHSTPRGDVNNKGNGQLTVTNVDANISLFERWTISCINAQPPGAERWRVTGSISGQQVNEATTGVAYSSDAELGTDGVVRRALSFLIQPGSLSFKEGDEFNFLTTGLTEHSAAVLVDDGEVVEPEEPDAVARVVSGSTTGLAPLKVVFKHDQSSDPRDAALTFIWDFGDGSPTQSYTDPNAAVEHTFTVPSSLPYTVTLTARNAFGLTDEDTLTVTVQDAAPPTVRASATPSQGERPLRVMFKGDLTTDPNPGTTGLDFVWDFGDGSPLEFTRNVEHTFENAGIYQATLTVTNRPYGKSAFSVLEVRVSGPAADQPPVAGIQVDKRFGNAPLTVNFDAGLSFDPEGGALDYEWDFRDGSPLVEGVVTTAHTFTAVGSYNVTLTVFDDSGQSDSATIVIVVTGGDSTDNRAPVARIVASSLQGPAPFTVTFDATSSSDPEGGNLSYAWDFGDGSEQMLGAIVAHTYTQPRDYTVVLSVSDSFGALGATTITISVTSPVDEQSGQDQPGGLPDGTPGFMSCGVTGMLPLAMTLLGLLGLRRVGVRRPR